MSETLRRWILFVAFLIAIPLPFYMFVVGGLLPMSALVYLLFHTDKALSVVSGVHILVYAPLLYLAARALARPLGTLGTSTMVLGSLAVACLPIYGAGHSSINWMNIFQLLSGGLR